MKDRLIQFPVTKNVLCIACTCVLFTFLVALTHVNYCYAIEYLNYTNDKYKVQFQYPAGSILIDQIPPVMAVSSNSTNETFAINYVFDFSVPQWFGTADLQLATTKDFEIARAESEYPVLEYMSPWFTNFHGHKAGTYTLTTKGSDYDKEKIFKMQAWLINIGPHGYYILYDTERTVFDSPEGIESRNHFINSIKFLE